MRYNDRIDTNENVVAVVSAYDQQGWHRTGTKVDWRSARWLAEQVVKRGRRCALDAFAFERLIPDPGYLEIEGRRIPGLTLFDAPLTSRDGVSGALVGPETEGGIALMRADPRSATSDLDRIRREGRHRGVVAVSESRRGGLAPRNAHEPEHPVGPPVLQVAARYGPWLEKARQQGKTARVVACGRRVEGSAANVLAWDTVPPDGLGAAPLCPKDQDDLRTASVVVLTPRSGWWHCAAERGGGLVCWLEAMRGTGGCQREVLFAATSGHELGFLGLKRLLERRGSQLKDAVWVHLGANLGTLDGQVRIATTDRGLGHLAVEVLTRHGCRVGPGDPVSRAGAGEATELARDGIRHISLVAPNPVFHEREDRWPGVVDPEELARLAAGVSDLVEALAVPTNTATG